MFGKDNKEVLIVINTVMFDKRMRTRNTKGS